MVDLDIITYVPTPNPVQASGPPLTGSGGKSKRQLCSEREVSGTPIMKLKSCRIKVFTTDKLTPVKRYLSASSSMSIQTSSSPSSR